ncbi:hypothetical protein [Pseudoflavonifractor phocaeensis]|uniref:hypothetical protein n=1 Tax=Pseudoflavonifractor phocaeensis TaxID=1870988 RepID=UPI001F3964E5|nr:hypothetical protein [Pseudoflavonifractor phocaeensis]MCF2661477.1 hypothetical protein [Pseudoflavonifractor phocaeensis]
MTDYLEPREGEDEDALWEAVRQLEQFSRKEDAADGPRGEETGPSAAPEEAEPPEQSGQEEEYLSMPLLEELEALDRALEGWGQLREEEPPALWENGEEAESGRSNFDRNLGGAQRGTVPWGELLPDAGETRRGSGEAGSTAWTDEVLQAEGLDRVFRRDSRRYDGGFFLY